MVREPRNDTTAQSLPEEGEHATRTPERTTEKATNWPRVGSSVVYFILAIMFVLLFEWQRHKNAEFGWAEVFYLDPIRGCWNLGRFVWCMSSSFVGFASLGVLLWTHDAPIWPRHFLYYPLLLLAISSLVFSACHMLERTSGFVFYYLSFGACFSLALLVDRFVDLVESVLRKRG